MTRLLEAIWTSAGLWTVSGHLSSFKKSNEAYSGADEDVEETRNNDRLKNTTFRDTNTMLMGMKTGIKRSLLCWVHLLPSLVLWYTNESFRPKSRWSFSLIACKNLKHFLSFSSHIYLKVFLLSLESHNLDLNCLYAKSGKIINISR
jgi:hypothetical protein